MNFFNVVSRIHKLGHAPEFPDFDSTFLEWILRDLGQELIRRYQTYHHLTVTGRIDAETEDHLEMSRCGLPDIMAVTVESRWGIDSLACYQEISYPGVDAEEIAADYAEAIRRMAEVCGIDIRPTTDRNAAQVLARSASIDGVWNTLALTQLPPPNAGGATVLQQTFDTAEVGLTREQRIGMMAHEAGHFLGLGHAPPGSGALMEPMLGAFTGPQPWDVAELQRRYGPPRTTPAAASPGPVAHSPAAGTGAEVSRIAIDIPTPGEYTYALMFDKPGKYLLIVLPVDS